jgi:hypothetical protein
MTTKFRQLAISWLLFLATSAVWAQTTPAPQLPSTCPDLSTDGFFNPEFWQINLQPLANAGQLQTDTTITHMPNSTFQSALWANYVTCDYNSATQGSFNLQSKFNTAPPQQINSHWQTVGYVVLCTSSDPKDCAFQATMMIPKPKAPSDLQIQQQDSLPHVPTDN